jgi:membrane protein
MHDSGSSGAFCGRLLFPSSDYWGVGTVMARTAGRTRTETVVGGLLVMLIAISRAQASRPRGPAGNGRDGSEAFRIERVESASQSAPSRDAAHGRRANRPSDIPKRGWWDISMRVKDAMSEKNLTLIAAGAAFYAFLAIPSAFTALVSLYGLVADPQDVHRHLELAKGVVPDQVLQIMSDQLQALTSSGSTSLGVGLIISVLVALWSARSGTASMVTAINVAYGEPEKRSMFRLYAITVGLTALTIAFALLALALIAVLPAIIGVLPLGNFGKTLAAALRWPVLLALVVVALAITYRFAPSRKEPRWRWVSWGAVAATVLWIVGSALFSIYVGQFASYNKTYGSLGGVVVLLMWLYVSALAVLLGAEMNAETEHQTAQDTTSDERKPLGQRGAKMADTVGAAR